MADRYWVGGTASWDGTAGSKWATTSGGAGGAAVPTSADDVFFDANSGAITVTVVTPGTRICKNLDFTGFTGTFAGTGFLTVNGNLTLAATFTWSYSGDIDFEAISTATIDCKGVSIPCYLFFGGSATFTLLSDLVTTSIFDYEGNGVFDANDFNVTALNYYLYADATIAPVFSMGSGTWLVTGDDKSLNGLNSNSPSWLVDEYDGAHVTINPETSTLKFSSSSIWPKTVETKTEGVSDPAVGKTYNNIWFTGSGTGSFVVRGTNTFNEFKVDTPPHTVVFDAGATNTISTWSVSGTAGNLVTIEGRNTTYEPDGVELITNGSFTGSAAGWTLGANWSYASNQVSRTAGGSSDLSQAVASLTQGVSYVVSSTFTGNLAIKLGSAGAPTFTSGDTYICQGTNGTFAFTSIGANTVDDVSMQVARFQSATATIAKSGGGTVSSDYLSINYMTATPGTTWYAGTNSTDGGNNSGWIFTAPPSGFNVAPTMFNVF